jgi:hypothetical protein
MIRLYAARKCCHSAIGEAGETDAAELIRRQGLQAAWIECIPHFTDIS